MKGMSSLTGNMNLLNAANANRNSAGTPAATT